MTVVSSTDFAVNQKKYLEMAVNSEICIKDDKYLYRLTANPIEPDIILQPDDDFRRAITMDEAIIRVEAGMREIIEKYKQAKVL